MAKKYVKRAGVDLSKDGLVLFKTAAMTYYVNSTGQVVANITIPSGTETKVYNLFEYGNTQKPFVARYYIGKDVTNTTRYANITDDCTIYVSDTPMNLSSYPSMKIVGTYNALAIYSGSKYIKRNTIWYSCKVIDGQVIMEPGTVVLPTSIPYSTLEANTVATDIQIYESVYPFVGRIPSNSRYAFFNDPSTPEPEYPSDYFPRPENLILSPCASRNGWNYSNATYESMTKYLLPNTSVIRGKARKDFAISKKSNDSYNYYAASDGSVITIWGSIGTYSSDPLSTSFYAAYIDTSRYMGKWYGGKNVRNPAANDGKYGLFRACVYSDVTHSDTTHNMGDVSDNFYSAYDMSLLDHNPYSDFTEVGDASWSYTYPKANTFVTYDGVTYRKDSGNYYYNDGTGCFGYLNTLVQVTDTDLINTLNAKTTFTKYRLQTDMTCANKTTTGMNLYQSLKKNFGHFELASSSYFYTELLRENSGGDWVDVYPNMDDKLTLEKPTGSLHDLFAIITSNKTSVKLGRMDSDNFVKLIMDNAGGYEVGDVITSRFAINDPDWLECNGGSFSSNTYPELATFLGGTILPKLNDGYYTVGETKLNGSNISNADIGINTNSSDFREYVAGTSYTDAIKLHNHMEDTTVYPHNHFGSYAYPHKHSQYWHWFGWSGSAFTRWEATGRWTNGANLDTQIWAAQYDGLTSQAGTLSVATNGDVAGNMNTETRPLSKIVKYYIKAR